MTDPFSKEKRSRIMANIKGKNTGPEKTVRECLRKLGCRYRTNVEGIPGKPDLRICGGRKLIFVHGCFWHGHKGCKRATKPETNKTFWSEKIQGNVKRDRRTLRELKNAGWEVLVVWQCRTKDPARLEKQLLRFIQK